ncbi:MAG TPA: PDZ domain-containing protein [Phycisphaerae bacterium]|nr:PDZ domain-containing protein [Phycisphaerales bacterium]HRX84600.1 PDZ domain-containing protein [Phycisphaerae bacterium]
MKALTWICTLGIAASAHAVVPAADATAAAPANAQAVVVTVEATDDGTTTKNVKIFQVGDDGLVTEGTGDAQVVVLPSAGAAADGQKDIRVLTRLATPADPNRGWLGVALGQTVTADGSGTTANTGVKVLNVVKDSPAEQAGLMKGDVITAINAAPVSDDVTALGKTIGDIGAGGVAQLSILRDGQPMELTATLTAPKSGSIQWLHTPDMTIRQKLHVQPGVTMLTPQGNMQFFNADDLDGTDGLPDAIAEMINRGSSMNLSVRNGQRVMELTNNDNGNVVEIRQEGDGPITVKRYAEGAKDTATETEYANADELAAGDPDAFDLYDAQAESSTNVWMNNDGDVYTFKINNVIPEDLHDQLKAQLGSGPAADEALQSAHEALMKAFGHGAMTFQGANGQNFSFGFMGKAKRTFKVTPDGQIEVTIRKGDNEVVKVYADEADLEARDPEAFDKYLDVVNADLPE